MSQRPFPRAFWLHLLTCLTIVFKAPLHFDGEPPLAPPKTLVIARKIVEIVIEGTVSIEFFELVMYFDKELFQGLFWSLQLSFEGIFDFVAVFLALPVFRYSSCLIYLCITSFVHQNKWDHFLLLPFLVSLLICLSISVSFDVLFKSSPCMLCMALLIPKHSRISRSVFFDACCVLTWISSTKDESSSSGMLSIPKPVGNSLLSLVAALKDLSSAGGILSMDKRILIVFTPPNLVEEKFLVKKNHLFASLKEPIYNRCKTRKLCLLS